MWHKFGVAALLILFALAPVHAQDRSAYMGSPGGVWLSIQNGGTVVNSLSPQYFDYPRYALPGKASPDNFRNSPPGRVSPFVGNIGYVPPSGYYPQPNPLYVQPNPLYLPQNLNNQSNYPTYYQYRTGVGWTASGWYSGAPAPSWRR